jgi:hypothetical protein
MFRTQYTPNFFVADPYVLLNTTWYQYLRGVLGSRLLALHVLLLFFRVFYPTTCNFLLYFPVLS